MSNTYEEITFSGPSQKAGPCQQLCGAIFCSFTGFFLFWGFLYGIAINEQRNVCTQRALSAALKEVVHLDCNGYLHPEPGKPSHVSCPLTEASLPKWTPRAFSDADWLNGAFELNAVKVRQAVSMFQCGETEHSRTEKQGDKEVKKTSWTYSMQWHENYVDSGKFKAWSVAAAKDALYNGCGRSFKGNPSFPMSSGERAARRMMAGEYDLTKYQKQVYASSSISLDGSRYYTVPRSFPAGGRNYASVSGNTVDTCGGAPEIGCVRIQYFQSTATEASFLGTMTHYSPSAWKAPASWMCSTEYQSALVELFGEGEQSASALVNSAEFGNKLMTWGLRIGLTILVVMSIRWFFEPIQTIANLIDSGLDWFKFIPLLGWGFDWLGNVVRGAVGFAITLISLGIGIPSSLFVLALAWVVMRPWFGIPLFIGAALLLGYTIKHMIERAKVGAEIRKKKEA